MVKSLIIVESFAKIRTISKYLNDKSNNFIVTASCGHVTELPKNELGFDTVNWEPNFIPSKQNIIDKIRDLVKKVDVIYLGSDPDVEGEAIAYHIKTKINDLLKDKKCYRISFNEITYSAIKKALESHRDINMSIVNAQLTRCILDKLVGYKLSPMLWKQFNSNYLSAGRVQSVAVMICANKLDEITNTKILQHWSIISKFKCLKISFEAKLYNDKTLIIIDDINATKKFLDKLSFDNKWIVNNIVSNSLQNPPPPLTTTSLQSEVYKNYKISSKKTMLLAQNLYEQGLITYMRTDSTVISNEAKQKIISYIKDNYGEDHAKIRSYKSKIINAQEAHECIRVTDPTVKEIDFENITNEHKKVYDLIWRRTIACQMIPSEYVDIEINIIDETIKPYKFVCNKSLLIKEGYLKVLCPKTKLDDVDELNNLHNKNATPQYFIAKGEINEIPSMYNEVALIKQLEKEGIGRPSTYSSIIDKIFSKEYVIKGSNPHQELKIDSIKKTKDNNYEIINDVIEIGGKNTDLLIPTKLGIDVNNYLYSLVPFLLDIKFTAQMETALDKIANNEATKNEILTAFYSRLKPVIDENIVSNITNTNTNTNKESGILKTKYGYAYYNANTNKYTNIESYLKWKKLEVKQLKEHEIKFLSSLPKKINNSYTINLGPYGLYLKDNKNNNIKFDKNKWDDAVNGKIDL